MFALPVASCCAKSGTSCYHKVYDGNRLAASCSNKTNTESVRNKLLRVACHQLVNNLLLADDIRGPVVRKVDSAIDRLVISFFNRRKMLEKL